ncbi:MAG: hypothetical protein ABI675_25675 [Chitinophagaceae bacterium]
MQNYIDVKVTIWNRLHFADESNMSGLTELIRESGLEEVIDEKLGFLESETLYDTEAKLTPEQNEGQATIEVYANKEIVWDNTTI